MVRESLVPKDYQRVQCNLKYNKNGTPCSWHASFPENVDHRAPKARLAAHLWGIATLDGSGTPNSSAKRQSFVCEL